MSAPDPIDAPLPINGTLPTACSGDADSIRGGRIPEHWDREIRLSGRKLAGQSTIGTISLAEDLFAVGLEALWRAAETFDCSYGTPFEHLARRSIRNAMLSELRQLKHPMSIALTSPLDDSLPRRLLVSEAAGPAKSYARAQRREAVRTWVETCPKRVRKVFDLLYKQGLTQREAAEIMQVSQARVAQYHGRLIWLGQRTLAPLLAA